MERNFDVSRDEMGRMTSSYVTHNKDDDDEEEAEEEVTAMC